MSSPAATVLNATPSRWQHAARPGLDGLPWLGKGICGGEALPQSLADGLLALGIALYNQYGPTEATVIYHLRPSGPADGGDHRPAHRQEPACTCSTRTCSPSPPACRASCGSAARRGPRLPQPARADRGAVRRATRSRRPASGCTAPATSARYRPTATRVPRPHRPPGQAPRLPDRARRDRVGSELCTPRCAAAGRVSREGDGPATARGYVVPSTGDLATPRRCRLPAATGCPVHGAAAFVALPPCR